MTVKIIKCINTINGGNNSIMLYLGSLIYINDNSGAVLVQIINLRKKKTYKSSFACNNSLVFGVIKKQIANKPLKKKKTIELLIVNTKKKNSRKNGVYLNFTQNIGIPVIKKKDIYEPLATKIDSVITQELLKKKIYKQVTLISQKSI